ncbi:maleylpyruvate isomerase family mycothiol-dependent enzyme [Kribbella catacumbae]|uniref:maleylpyruvate isomerase family mycothiol-dependent enzyme n=1 Tax=Kribbella catacumbae TaxID=460086 RepID=UPI0003821D7E|nr:maleylpyruvate isomerase family mycothiol-dependent enzyme [Kribbella catacumbae]
MSNAETVIAALRTGYDRLADLVKKFDDEDLARGSAATEWDVAQVLSHLGSGAEIMRSTVLTALEVQPAADGDYNQSVWDRWNAMPRREQAEGFLDLNEKYLNLLESLDADQRESLRIDLGFLPAPLDVAAFARMRLAELTLHSWDVRSTFDPQATLDTAAIPELLQRSDNLGWISKPAALNGQYAVLRVATTEPATEFTLHLTDPVSIDFNPTDASADGTLSLPAEAWLRLVAGRLAPTFSDLELTGPVSLETLREVFPGY